MLAGGLHIKELSCTLRAHRLWLLRMVSGFAAKDVLAGISASTPHPPGVLLSFAYLRI
jgi:hypothetical protein